MHPNSPFWYKNSKNFLERGIPPPHNPSPSAPSAPRSSSRAFGAQRVPPKLKSWLLPCKQPICFKFCFWANTSGTFTHPMRENNDTCTVSTTTTNTLDSDQSNYSSRIVFSYICTYWIWFNSKSRHSIRRPENHTLQRNMEWIRWSVAEISPFAPWFCSFKLWRFTNHLLT